MGRAIHLVGFHFSRRRLGSLWNTLCRNTVLDLGLGSSRMMVGLKELNSYSVIIGLGIQVGEYMRSSKMPPVLLTSSQERPRQSPSPLPLATACSSGLLGLLRSCFSTTLGMFCMESTAGGGV